MDRLCGLCGGCLDTNVNGFYDNVRSIVVEGLSGGEADGSSVLASFEQVSAAVVRH